MDFKTQDCKESSTIKMGKEKLWITWHTREPFWVNCFGKSFYKFSVWLLEIESYALTLNPPWFYNIDTGKNQISCLKAIV